MTSGAGFGVSVPACRCGCVSRHRPIFGAPKVQVTVEHRHIALVPDGRQRHENPSDLHRLIAVKHDVGAVGGACFRGQHLREIRKRHHPMVHP